MTSSSPALPERLDAPTAVPASRRILLAGAEQMALVGSWEWIPATGEVRWSDNLFRLFGLEPGEVTPSTDLVLQLTHPDDTERVARYLDAMATQGTAPPIEYRIILPHRGVRHFRSTVAAVETNGAEPRMIVGCIQDVTDQRCAERENASRFAVSSALAEWQTFEQGAEGLLRKLVGAMGAQDAALWLPDGDLLVATVFWTQDQDQAGPSAFEATRHQLRLPSGVGLPGRVWERKTPISARATEDESGTGEPAEPASLSGFVALPALHGDEVLAVLEFCSIGEIPLTDRLMRSLTGIAYELGEFLGRRRGELAPPRLTPREVEVLQLAAHGQSGRQIAERLLISPATVKTHFQNIYSKLGARDRAAAVANALRSGVID